MRNRLLRVVVITDQETLPEFIKLEQALINKIDVLQRNLNDELNKISENDGIQIPPSTRNEIRRILFDTQRALGNIARTYAHSTVVLNFYRDVNRFVQMVEEMEMMFCQILKNCAPKTEVSEEDALLLNADESDSVSEKTAEELFSEFSADNNNNLLADHSDMIRQIEQVGDLSGAIYAAVSRLIDKNAQEPIFLNRFFDARRIVSEAIEKIHHAIHRDDQIDSVAAGPRRRAREATVASAEARCYEFGLLSLCSDIKKQMRALLEKNNEAQTKRIKILKMICSLANRMPESLSSSDSSSGCTSSESSDNDTSSDDSSRSSSLASSRLFSRSRSPSPVNSDRSTSSAARPG